MGEVTRKRGQVEQEQLALDRMHACLDTELAAAAAARGKVMTSLVDDAASRQAREAELSRLTAEVDRLRRAERTLCFGRIDSTLGAMLHIGRTGLRSEAGKILLVDWRAEAARPFYTATTASPHGLRRRRHLRVEGRRVVDVVDEVLDGSDPRDEDIVGDGPLALALNEARTGRMREAASTLQREQDEIVRSEHRGLMIVEGGPGTGKTIVALHRAAYVLYAFPSIARRGVLVFGPNRRFLDYISDVLPSLGEDHVELATASDLVGAGASRPESEPVARAKGGSRIAAELAKRVRAHQPCGAPLCVMTTHGQVILDPARVDAIRRGALYGGIGHNRGRQVFVEHVVDELVSELEQQTANDISDFEQELKESTGIDLDLMFAHRARDDQDGLESPRDDLEIDWDRVRDEMLADPSLDRVIDGVWPRLHAEDLLHDLLTDPATVSRMTPELAEQHVLATVEGAAIGWSDADLPLLDEARALVDGEPDAIYGHIVVDEAQQLSEMEWRMLMRRCPSRSMTVVGDLAQAGPTTAITTWDDAVGPFVADRYVRHTLTVNYRTTAEILDAAGPTLALIAPAQRLSDSIRHGPVPVSIRVDPEHGAVAVGDLVARLQRDHPEELIGVIVASRREREMRRRHFAGGVVVVAASEARGLEFDNVIIVGPDEIRGGSEAGLRDLYVAQTRATKRLFTLSIAPDDVVATSEVSTLIRT